VVRHKENIQYTVIGKMNCPKTNTHTCKGWNHWIEEWAFKGKVSKTIT
jgi:hypothetical protein